MYKAMKKNPFATNRGGLVKPSTKPDTEKINTTSIKGNDLRSGK